MFQEDLQEINLKSNTLYVNISQLETSAAGQEDTYKALSSEAEELNRQTGEISSLKESLLQEKAGHEAVKAGAEQTIEELNQKLEEEVLKAAMEIRQRRLKSVWISAGYIQKQNFLDENIRRTSEEVKGLVRTGEELRERQNEILAEIQKKQGHGRDHGN